MAGENGADGRRRGPDTTALANRAGADPAAAAELLARVYDRLRRRAAGMVAGDRAGQDMGATALVHQAYERLCVTPSAGPPADGWASGGHFRAAFARTMQRVLIDHARSQRRLRRGGGRSRVDLTMLDVVGLYRADPDVVLDVHDAFRRLAKAYPKCHAVAVHRVYGGLTVAQAADQLGVNEKTVDRRWTMAQAFLRLALPGHAPDGASP